MLFSSVFAITGRRDMGLYEVPLSMSLLGFGMVTMLSNFHMCGIMLVLRAMRVQEGLCVLGGWCLACQDLVSCSFYFVLLPLVVSVMLYPCILCVALLMDLFVLCVMCLTVFVNCLVKQFAMCLGVVAILLLNGMEVFYVGGGAPLDRPCMVFQRMCVVCL